MSDSASNNVRFREECQIPAEVVRFRLESQIPAETGLKTRPKIQGYAKRGLNTGYAKRGLNTGLRLKEALNQVQKRHFSKDVPQETFLKNFLKTAQKRP